MDGWDSPADPFAALQKHHSELHRSMDSQASMENGLVKHNSIKV